MECGTASEPVPQWAFPDIGPKYRSKRCEDLSPFMTAAYTPAKLAPGKYPYWENGKENGNYCSIMGHGVYWEREKKMETIIV